MGIQCDSADEEQQYPFKCFNNASGRGKLYKVPQYGIKERILPIKRFRNGQDFTMV